MDRQPARADERSGEGAERSIPPLEWLASGLGLLLTAGVFASIGWEAVTQVRGAPIVTVEVKDVAAVEGGFRVDFRARNKAGATAAQVEIEGRLSTNEGSVETSRVVLDYIPGHSQQDGGLFFTRDPRSSSFAVRALGFTRP
jgi:uncharacterized protein (TIGR02588 family)